jgi:hypothetical protein
MKTDIIKLLKRYKILIQKLIKNKIKVSDIDDDLLLELTLSLHHYERQQRMHILRRHRKDLVFINTFKEIKLLAKFLIWFRPRKYRLYNALESFSPKYFLETEYKDDITILRRDVHYVESLFTERPQNESNI